MEAYRDAHLTLLRETILDAVVGPCRTQPWVMDGTYWTDSMRALTMVGRRRLDNMRELAEDVVNRNIPGDFLEAGCWRGGVAMFVAGVWKSLRGHEAPGRALRRSFAADSFKGFPPSDAQIDVMFHDGGALSDAYFGAYSPAGVLSSASALGLVPGVEIFVLYGYFNDTLPAAVRAGALGALSILRLDGDLYSSTMDTLNTMYDLVSPGGWIVADDVTSYVGQRAAILDFFAIRGLPRPDMHVVWHDHGEVPGAIYWRKER